MDWIVLAIIVFAVGGFLFLRFGGTVSTDEARRHLREGALLVDVRTPSEFAGGSVPGAINIPLSALPDALASHAPNKDRVLLLHCQSGSRSSMAARRLRSAGYTRVFNVGSFGQAQNLGTPAQR